MTHAGFWSWQLVVAMVLNCAFQALTVAAYASRLAGARSGRVATAISLFNIFATSSRFAQMFYMPMLGALSDRAILTSIATFEWQLRSIVFAGTAGVIVGTIAIPTFVLFYLRAIGSLERYGSVPKAMLRLLRPRTVLSIFTDVKFRLRSPIGRLPYGRVPRDVLVLNTLVTMVYGIGVVAASYASVLAPEAARTAVLSSGLINGFATIAYNVVVDPASAMITDQTVRGERSIDDVKALVAGLSGTAIAGFLLSQLLLVPAAVAVRFAANVFAGH